MEKDILKTKGMRLTEENVFYFSIRYKRIMAAKFTAYQEWVFISTGCCCGCTDSPNTLWLPRLSDMLCRRGERCMVSLILTWDEMRQKAVEERLDLDACFVAHVSSSPQVRRKQFHVQEKCEKKVYQLPAPETDVQVGQSSPFASCFSLLCILTLFLACSLLPAVSTTETRFSSDVYTVHLTTSKSPCKILYSSWL